MVARRDGVGGAALALMVMLSGAQASAQMLMVDQPMTEARLRDRGVDLAVRFEIGAGDRFKIDAAFTEPFDGAKLGALSIELAPGESVIYSPPGRAKMTYRFVRDRGVLIVTVHSASRLRLGALAGG